MALAGPVAGGANLGAARGRIVIDLSDLQNVRVQTQAVGQQVRQNLAQISAGAQGAQASFGGMAQSLGSVGNLLGIAFGVEGVRRIGQFALAAERTATAYQRQQVAALNLAGSQQRLNDLLTVYDRATGGAIDRASALSDVTRLQAVGFADSAEELEKFVQAARGISVATGQSQDYVISQLQLAIANQSTLRLDQLGLGVSEVQNRIEQLRASNRGLTEEMAYQQAILGLAEQKFGALATSNVAQATGAEQAARAWRDLRLELGGIVRAPVNQVGTGLAKELDLIREEIHDLQRDVEAFLNSPAGRFLSRTWSIMQADPMQEVWDEALAERARTQRQDPVDVGQYERESRLGPNPRGVSTIRPRFEAAQLDAIDDWSAGVRDIERSATVQRLQASRQYEEQRSQIIRDYGLTVVREAEDFARQRARAEQQMLDDIADVRADAARREEQQARNLARSIERARTESSDRIAEWEEDYNERVAEARAESNERIQEIEEDYQREREQAERDSRERIQDAASRLDAGAVRDEQRRAEREREEAERDHQERLAQERENLAERTGDERKALDERIADEREQLDKRIRQEQEAYDEQLRLAREADEQRILDMQADFDERKRIEDEDRAIRLGRMAEDHNDQLGEMDRQHGARIEQIQRQAASERRQLDEEFKAHMVELGTRNDAWIKEVERLREAAIKNYDAVFNRMADPSRGSHPSEADPYIDLPPPSGSSISSTIPASSASTRGRSNLNIGSFVINANGLNEQQAYRVARRAAVDLLEEYSD